MQVGSRPIRVLPANTKSWWDRVGPSVLSVFKWKSTEKNTILLIFCMQYACVSTWNFFDTFRILQEHDWRRLEFKLSKSVTPAVMLGMPFQTFTISMILDHGRRRPGQVVRRSRFWRIFLIGSHWLVNLTNNEKIWFHLAFSNSYFRFCMIHSRAEKYFNGQNLRFEKK